MSSPSSGAKLPELSAAKRAMLEARLKGKHRPSSLVRRVHGDRIPLSFAQERLYFLDRLQPGSAAYNMATALRLPGDLDAAVLERALGEVMRRHESLRTVFREADGAPVQVVQPFAGFTLPIEDLSGLDDAESAAEVARRTAAEATRPFDLAAGPLFRGTLLRLGARDHVLLMCMHHIVSDGWSMEVLRREVPALYAAFRDGRPSPLPELAVQYTDYSVWQREQAQGGVLERQLGYWKGQLAGAPELLELPTDHPRPPASSFRGSTVPFSFPVGLLEELQAVARNEGTTLFMVVLAAFQVLLSKYAGSADVIVGTPIAGRTHREMEGIVGFFVNTLVLRTDLSGDPDFRDVLRRVRETVFAAYENQDLPFEKLVAELQPERSLSHSPFFQVMLVMENAEGAAGSSTASTPSASTPPASTPSAAAGPVAVPAVPAVPADSGGGPDADRAGSAHATAKFDLTLGMGATANGLVGEMEYSTDLFERSTIQRMIRHLGRVLAQLAADPGVRLSALDLLDAAERVQVVTELNRTDAPVVADPRIHALFQAQAARTPDAVALVGRDGSLTYGEVDARANRLANHLVGLSVGPEVRVALCMEPGVEPIIALLAVLKAGGVYVPLDPASPPERMARMMEDAGVAVLLTEDGVRERVPIPAGLPVVSVDGDRAVIEAASAEDPGVRGTPDDLAYVIFTSGSTGVPKGVAVEHRGVCNLVPSLIQLSGLGPDSRALLLAPLHFDASVAEIFSALCAGAALYVAEGDDLLPGDDMIQRLRGARITHTKFTPSALAALPSAELPELATLVVGGEACTADLVDRWGHHRRFINVYGPTEVTVRVTAFLCEPGAGAPPIGAPLPNVRLYVLDATGRPAPMGVPGELYAGGIQLARGYLGRPDLTAEKFVPDAFGGVPGARLYRTGDRARWRADGTLQYLGRADAQVKIRGYRIEPGEVEAVLRRHPAVAECAVIAREDVPGDRRLVAYVAGEVDADALRAHLRQSVPEYMVPSAFVPIDRIPLTPNGKLDRRALPAPAYAATVHVLPRTPAEEVLAAVWAEVLNVERVGVTDTFFDLGGHSLMAMRVVSRVREVFGVELPLRALFEGPTVQAMALRVEEIRRAGEGALPPVLPLPRTGPVPLSFAQERLWFLDQLQPGTAFYNIPAALRLGGALDAAALERALGETVRRHDALRTVFAEAEGRPVQVILPFAGFVLPVEDLSALDGAEREAAARRRAAEEATRPFDLAAGPLFRASLLRLAPDEHVLVMCVHHVVSDGWSMEVLFRELSVLYGAYRQGDPSPLPDLPVQYADYAVWQREQLEGEVLNRQLAYWKGQLGGAPELLELPADHPRPPHPSHRGGTVPVQLSAALLERLQALGRGEGATLYMVLLGAFQVLLAKYAGTDDVVVGSPIAGRTRRETEGLIGFFVNTLVLRTDLGGDPGFREVVRRVRGVTLGAYEHQDVPFERLVEELRPERSLSHAPLFQVMFTLENAAGAGGAGDAGGAPGEAGGGIPGLEVGRMGADVPVAKFDLMLGLAATPQGLLGALDYSTDLFERATAERMAAHLERVLEQVAADADRPLSALELVGAEERARVEAWNATAVEYPSDAGIPALFEEWAARTPDAVALAFAGGSVTYAELDARANRLARYLRRYGVGPEVRVALCLERGPELVAAILAILKAGGAYVPLDPAYPAGRLAFMLADSGAAVLVTQESLRAGLPSADGVGVVSLDGAAAEIAAEDAAPLGAGTGARGLAYVMYTSGSTGTPKGVGVEHRSVVRLVRGADYVALGPDEVILQAAPVSFDASTLEIWGALLNGGRLALMSAAAPSLEELGRSLREHAVTTLWLTSGLFQAMVEERLDDLGDLRQLLAGGDVLPAWHVIKVRERFPHIRLVNGYGPTENTTFTCCYSVPNGWSGASVPIGGPIPNTRVYVLDEALRPVPIGLPGELFAAGDGLARGYVGRPALTAERFIPDPFVPGGRMYRTGDRVRWLAEGVVEYRGRLDEQVKIRGFRIEPGEIESVLRGMDGVGDCAVIVREDAPGDKRLVAYVVGDGEPDALRASLRGRLPEYMVPGAFVFLDALPLTPNGKLDRKALPAPDYAGAADAYVAPRTPTEEMLAGTWAEVLRLDRVGVAENFFHLGGHSLLATRVVSRIREVFGVELPLRALFEGPTVAEMAERVEEIRRAGVAVLPPVVPVERTGPLPLSFAQERLYFLDRLAPGSALYNMPFALRLDGALDVSAAERALGEVVRRHEALRTIFAETDAGTMQIVVPFDGFVLPVEDFAGLADEEREAAARRRALQEAVRPFDLSAGPLFRALLLRLGAEEHVLLMTMHHIVGDGWSMDVLFREMSALYAAYAQGGESPLPELAVQYADFAVWQREQLQGEVLDGQMAYWKDQLTGAPEVLDLPTDRPRSAVQTQRGGTVAVMLPEDVLQRLTGLARAEGATLYMVLLGAFQSLLSKYSGSEDIVVGTPIAGRTRRETEGLIGFFVNTLVLRTDLAGNPSFREVVRRVRDVTLGAYDHQEVPFEQLVAELQPERSLSHSPLFQVMFTLNEADAGEGGTALPGLSVRTLGGQKQTTKFDLTLTCSPSSAGLGAMLEYNTDLFDRDTIERMLEHLGRLVGQVAEDPERRLSDVELLTEAEAGRVLEEWNGTERPYPLDRGIHHLVEAQVARTPDAIAVVHEGQPITYAALNASANRLAHALRDRGMGRGSFVPVLAERGPHVAVAMLAAMKTGAAFVPLDARWPEERLRRVLDDLRAPVMLAGAGTDNLAAVLGIPVLPVQIGGADDTSNPESGTGPDDPIYAIYTSGSTGVPKGAVVPHGGISNRFHWMTETFGAESARSVLQTTRHVYDSAVWQLFWPLTVGGQTVIPRPDGETDADYLVELIRTERVTMTDFVPSVFNALVPELAADASARERLSSLRTVIVGGEQITAETTYRFMDLFPGVGVVNLYGPTECSIGSIHHPVSAADGSRIPIGRPIANTSALILDRGGRLVPQGVPGEIHLGGRCVGLGYIGDGKRTSTVFIPNPYAPRGGERLYRTGDLGRYRADGSIECLGRLDEQVKIRGFRIEPGEVETVLRRMDGVRDCAVIAREDRPGDRRLVAYVAGGADLDGLRMQLRQLLPDYMVPAAFVAVDALPVTANGKLDRRALPAPEYGGGDAMEEPRNFVEVQLIQLWEELLGVGPIGPTQSFFDAGGTSLVALRLFSQVNRRFECDLPVATLFEGATVRHMADAILTQKSGVPAAPEPVVALRPGGSLPPLFVVHATDRDVLGYVNLVRHLGADQPVYGVRDLAADLSRPIPVMAAEHVAEIRAVQPEGPYCLAGWSYGGLVAFEIASQLQREGAEVAFLGLLDSFSPALLSASQTDADTVLAAGADAARRTRRSLALSTDDLHGMPRDEQIRLVLGHLQAQGPAVTGLDYETLDADAQVLRDRFVARQGYAPAPLDTKLTLFGAAETAEAYADRIERTLPDAEERRTLGWSRFSTRPVAVHAVTGGHYSMMTEPHVRVLVERVRAVLADARRSASSTVGS